MEKFTLKDFITYNNPCFSCNENIFLRVRVTGNNRHMDSQGWLRPLVKPELTEISIKENYSNALKLQILHQSNKILTSDLIELSEYLKEHRLYLTSQCGNCSTTIDTEQLEFNLEKGFLKPVKLAREDLLVQEPGSTYHVSSNFSKKKSRVHIYKPGSQPIEIDLPLYSLAKFKTKEKFLHKLKTYAIFS